DATVTGVQTCALPILYRDTRGCGIQVQQSQREEHLRLWQFVQRLIRSSEARSQLFFGLLSLSSGAFFMPSSQSEWDAKHRLAAEIGRASGSEKEKRTM